MEGVSLAVGVIGLAGIFSTCLRCFEYFETAKSFQQNYDDQLLLLDCQKERLMTWGELVGMLEAGEEGRDPDSVVGRCLLRIISLLSDAEQLQGKCGVLPLPTSENSGKLITGLGSERVKKLRNALARLSLSDRLPNRPGPLLRGKWAIHDKAKFETLVSTVEKLVTELHRLSPVEKRSQANMVRADIARLDISDLRLVERVCEEPYPFWSDAASAIIIASEVGSIAPRSIREWSRQNDSAAHRPANQPSEQLTADETRPMPNTGNRGVISPLLL